ncbi:MAG TPA: ABC transporter ATP-binding protein [Phycisphaerales bacterium]|nr:ABC transporter ATP-binding protein [Phycisphaerales bacterium]
MIGAAAEINAEPVPGAGAADAARPAPERDPAGGAPREPAIELRAVGKCYQIYKRPADRLKQALTRWRRTYYREFWAVRDVTFTLHKGETLGIIGRNGSGKSTLAQMIAGTLSPTEGEVRVHGQVSALLELGAGFNQEFTGRENVYLAGAIRGFSRKEINRLFGRIVEFADIGDFIDQPVKTYSSGMYVRLAFAVAAQVRPEILVVDEALAVGDVFFQQKCHRYMREDLAGATKLIVTHDLNAVANHCDRAIVMHRGRVAFEGPPLGAIAFYTRIVHNERFGGAAPVDQGDFRSANSPASAPPEDPVPWTDVDEAHRGGAGEVLIERVAITDPNGEAVRTLQPGDAFACHYQVSTAAPKANLIFGVMVYDRFGKAICGDNTLSIRDGRVDFPMAGRYVVRLDYRWPELQPGEYTATFGVGEGLHAHHHTVQCWAHNVLSITAISPRRPVHGLFTNPLQDVRVTRVG